jgi:hypothetical protein
MLKGFFTHCINKNLIISSSQVNIVMVILTCVNGITFSWDFLNYWCHLMLFMTGKRCDEMATSGKNKIL